MWKQNCTVSGAIARPAVVTTALPASFFALRLREKSFAANDWGDLVRSHRLLVLVAILTLSLSAFGDQLTFSGGVQPGGYFGLLSGSGGPIPAGTFTLVAPINVLVTSGGGTYVDSAVLAMQTGTPVGSLGPNTLTYNSGVFSLYTLADWNFSTISGVNPLLAGTLGNGLVVYLQPLGVNDLLVTGFIVQVNGGSLLGNFGGYNLASNGPIRGGGAFSASIDVAFSGPLGDGLYSVPMDTQLTLITPEPSTMILLVSGLAFTLRRRRHSGS